MTPKGLIFKLEINWTLYIGISQKLTGHEREIIATWVLLISGFHLTVYTFKCCFFRLKKRAVNLSLNSGGSVKLSLIYVPKRSRGLNLETYKSKPTWSADKVVSSFARGFHYFNHRVRSNELRKLWINRVLIAFIWMISERVLTRESQVIEPPCTTEELLLNLLTEISL